MSASHEYFFELLTEEIPAWMLPPAGLPRELEKIYREAFGIENAVEAGLLFVDATSRRLFFRMSGLPERQPDRDDEVKGPPRKAAYTPEGAPAPALNGFLKKNNATADDIISAAGDDYIRIRRNVRGQAATEILQARIPAIVESLRWPKTMRWGRGEHSYIRPVHSVISVFDGKVVPLSIFGMEAGNRTVGHRILAPGAISVSSYGDYVEKLGAAHVVVEAYMRERAMKQSCQALAEQVGGSPAEDETIWQQWRFLTEFPGIVRAQFRDEYLSIPPEVLITVMRVHQKQLPIVAGGKVTNHFLAVMDQTADSDGNVASGNAFVCNARFADASFFYRTDRRRTLESRFEELSHLQFQEKLGDYHQKTQRIVGIADKLLSRLQTRNTEPGTRNHVLTAARLCKTDLMTDMVREFTELQGKVGGIYAREEGQPEEIWTAIYDHYMPAGAEDTVPRMVSGAILSLADRIDTLAGFFLLGMKPTGSKDPFALRRAAQGVVQILLTRQPWSIPISVDDLIDIGLSAHDADATASQKAKGELLEFFADRVRTQLENVFAYDEVAAAMAARWSDSLLDLTQRAEAVRAMRLRPEFLSILRSAKRIENITAGHEVGRLDPARLEHPAEKRLAELASVVGAHIDELTAERKYSAALESFAGMADELEKFFVEVMVMVEDEALRSNRMALLQQVGSAVGRIAELTRIVIDRSDYA